VYISPEQVNGARADHRSDIYALGTILYEMAAGRAPFSEGTTTEIVVQRLQRPPRPLAELRPEIPVHVRRIVARCRPSTPPRARLQEILRDLDAGRRRQGGLCRFLLRRRGVQRVSRWDWRRAGGLVAPRPEDAHSSGATLPDSPHRH
jgi:serine/threonine protein kinase